MLRPPVISLPDPLLEQEGSVDPLSLQRTYERLADRMLPAVTVRMSRIRFVSVMCVGARACAEYEVDTVASDGVTPPWLVFEWFVIEALARAGENIDQQAIAGLRKVRTCLEAQRHVSNATYLKTPKVFGFTGIFRRLATQATIVDDDVRLDDGGWQLLRAFEKDEALPGLIEGNGEGAALVRDLRDAIERGLERGHTVARPAGFWERVARHLTPTRTRKRERVVLLERLRGTQDLSRELVDDLVKQPGVIERQDEPSYLRGLADRTSAELARLLRAIDAYEALCRPISDALTLVRYLSTTRGPIGAVEFVADTRTAKLVTDTVAGCRRVRDDPALLDLEPDVRVVLDAFDDVTSPSDLFTAVVSHHERAQRDKPPDGKRPWLEPGRTGTVLVRPAYRIAELGELPPPYVHDYRTKTVGRFLTDLGVYS